MASLVAQKPSDNPANPPQIMSPSQMISVGADPAALDDYLNLDLFGAGPATLRASNSPASSHGALPVTPGTSDQAAATASPRALFPALDASPSNGLSFLDSYAPLDKNFGAFPDLSMLPGSSMDLGMGTGLDQYSNLFQDMFPATGYADPGPSTSDALFGVASAEPQATLAPAPSSSSAIDPQLFTAPTPAPAPVSAVPLSAPRAMTVDEDDDEDDNSDDDASIENDEVAPLPTTSTRSTTVRRPRKNAGAAGGIAKRPSRASTPASIVPSYVQFEDPKPVVPPALGKGGVASYLNGERIGSQEPDEWRPTPEEYKKLSSKEKRQLRNKISARNFRVRRKEYISTLESHIADRDQLISAIRSELSTTRNENSELRREIDALKVSISRSSVPALSVKTDAPPPNFHFHLAPTSAQRAIQEGRLSAEATGLPPPRPLTPEGTPVTSTPARRTKEINRPNTRKDLSSNNSGRSFWGGAIGNGGVTPVHTAIIPEVFPAVPQLSDKRPQSSSPPSSASPATPPSEGVNMNPLMNLSPLFGSSKLPGSPALNIGLDVMGDAFNQRTLDGFRAQLWGRMAKEAGARSVGRERAAAMEGVETESSPVDSSAFDSAGSLLSQPSSSSDSPQQTMSSSVSSQSTSSTSPSLSQPTVSSSPSLSLLNSPSSIRSVLEPTASSSQPAPIPSLFQASIFGAGFGTGKPVHNTFSQQNASSAQARAMLQAQWLALQQSRQLAAATPNVMSEVQAQAAQRQHQPSVTAAQREAYLAQFAQAVSAHQAQQQAQQSQLNGMAKEVRPAFFTRETTKSVPVTEKKSAIVEKLLPSTPTTEKKGATPQQAAAFATAASQTLLGRMGSAFWDAFSGAGGKTDTDKVRKVLEGKAVVRIVDIEKDKELDGLEERMKKLSVAPASLPSCSATCTPSGLGVFSNLRGKE